MKFEPAPNNLLLLAVSACCGVKENKRRFKFFIYLRELFRVMSFFKCFLFTKHTHGKNNKAIYAVTDNFIVARSA